MSGSSTPAQQTQQTTASNEPPAYIKPFLQDLTGQAMNLYNADPTGPDFFPNETVAPWSPQTSTATGALFDRGQTGSALGTATRSNLTDTANGKFLDIGNNPYFQGALEASFKPQTQALMETILPGLDSKFMGSGRTAGGAHVDTTMRAVRDLGQSQADASAKAALGAYTGERSNQMAAGGLFPQFQAADYQDINAMGAAGKNIDEQKQREIDADVARYNFGENQQFNNIARYLALINGGYPGGTTNSTSTGTATPPSNGTSSLLSGLMSGAGLGLSAFAAFSDDWP